MTRSLNLLLVEDSEADEKFLLSQLRDAGFDPICKRVETEAEFLSEIQKRPDIIISDYAMPLLNGLQALKALRSSGLDIPFILVSGKVGEEVAVEIMKQGATDYLLKDRLARLGQSVLRALGDRELRRQRQKMEEELQQSQAQLQSIVENLTEGLVVYDLSGQVLRFNRAALELHGFPVMDQGRRYFTQFAANFELSGMDNNALPLEQWPLSRILRGEKLRNMHVHVRHRHSDWRRIFRYGGTLVDDAAGNPLFAVVTINDITDQVNLQAQFVEAQKMEVVGQLAGGVAHDFNNILAVIMSYSELLMEDVGMDSEARKSIEPIRDAAERAAGLTRQLLIFSRKQTVETIVLDLNEVVSGMEKMLRRLIDENIELTFSFSKEAACAKADSGHVGQVLMNLVVNARDAIPHGGTITVETKRVTPDEDYASTHKGVTRGKYIMLSVNDTGTGMTPETKAQLFKAFFTTKPAGKGTGLGLVTCQTIVQQCGGYIEVDSQVGRGTTFKVYFPAIDLPVTAARNPVQNGPLPRGTETLLVVEDEPNVRHLAQRVLEAQGYEVLKASNGQDALHVAREHKGAPICMVISDVIMPQMGGKVMVEWLKSDYPALKILFTSGYTDDAIAHHGVLDPEVAFLPKPYTPITLTRKVREILDAPV